MSKITMKQKLQKMPMRGKCKQIMEQWLNPGSRAFQGKQEAIKDEMS